MAAKQRYAVSGEEYRSIQARFNEIMRQIENGTGSSLDPQQVLHDLQLTIEHRSATPSTKKGKQMPVLVHGLFSSIAQKIENVMRWNEHCHWGFTEQDFKKLPPPPAWPSNRLVTVTLVPYLADPRQTFLCLVKLMRQEFWEFMTDFYEETLTEVAVTGTEHQPGLKWEVIDMGGGFIWEAFKEGQSERTWFHPVTEIPGPDKRPNAGILAEALHSPYWARQMDSWHGTPGVYVPGYAVSNRIGSNGRLQMPYLSAAWQDNYAEVVQKRGVSMKGADIKEPPDYDGRWAYPVLLS